MNPNNSINLEHVLIQSLGSDNDLEFTLIDGSIVSLDKSQLWTAFNVIASNEFDDLCVTINRREDALSDASEACDQLVAANELDADALYNYGRCMKAYGRNSAMVNAYRDKIIKMVGWQGWIDATRVYECVTGTPREWLS